MTGAIYGSVDIDRIISNMLVRKLTSGTDPILVFDERALGALEDLLDARFKMYKWLYGHHMVVACNELLKRALIDAIKEKSLKYDDFHWKNFSEGRITEGYMMSIIAKRVLQDKSSPFRGLIDRRYLPVSVLKRQSEQKSFLTKLAARSRTNETVEALLAKIGRWFRKSTSLKNAEPPGRKPMLLAVNSPRTPYKPLKVRADGTFDENERITIWDSRENESSELTALSDYFRNINEEWRLFPSFYFSYLVPGKKKSEYAGMRDQVEEDILKEIAEIN